jgi:ketopantoate reductase
VASSSRRASRRDLDEEIVFQRESLARGDSARRLPIYNQVWTSLRHGAPGEASAYHRRFVEMGARHGIETPANTRLLAAVERATREQRGPESVGAEELLG